MNAPTPEDYERMKQFEQMKKEITRRVFDKKALERVARLRLVKPELVNQLEIYVVQLYQAGQIKTIITDNELLYILETLNSKSNNFNIKRK